MEIKTMEQKWEELSPHKEQMKKWAGLAVRLDAAKNLHPIERNKAIKIILGTTKEEDELLIMYKVLKVAFEQFEDATEDELKIAEE